MMTIFYIYTPPLPPPRRNRRERRAAGAGCGAGRDAHRLAGPDPEIATGRAEDKPRTRAPGRADPESPGPALCPVTHPGCRLLASQAGGRRSRAGRSRRPSLRTPARGRPGSSPQSQGSGRRPGWGGNDGQGQPRGRNPSRLRAGWGKQPRSQGAGEAGWESNKEPLLTRRRRARSRPSPLSAVPRGVRPAAGGRPAPRLPSPLTAPSPPGEGGEEGGACVFLRRAPRLLPGFSRRSRLSSRGCRSCRLHTASAAGAASAGLWSGGRARGPGGHPSEGGRGSSRGRRRRRRRWGAVAAAGPARRLGLSAPSPAFLSPSSLPLRAGASALCEEMV